MKLVTINQQSWAKTSEKCWLYSILLSLGRDIYELNSILQKSQAHSDTPFLNTLVNSHPKIILDTVKNMTDVFLPLSSLGYFKAPRFVALCGLTSSLSAALQIINPKLKL